MSAIVAEARDGVAPHLWCDCVETRLSISLVTRFSHARNCVVQMPLNLFA